VLDKTRSEIWAWCLLPNPMRLIVVPSHEEGLRQVGRIKARNTLLIAPGQKPESRSNESFFVRVGISPVSAGR